jgi:CRP/FNR family cyclic AMP-dependent transcriptional regulator
MVAARAINSANGVQAQPCHEYLAAGGPRKTVLNVPKGKVIYSQGDPGDSIFYIQKGRVKLSVTSPHGKEATLALHNKGDFIGEECMGTSHPQRLATAIAILPCTVLRIDSKEMTQALDADKSLVRVFQSFLLNRCVLMQADLIDHLFNSSERRLARTLLVLAQLEGGIEATIPYMTQETLAQKIGTTRSRVSCFMNRFRELGYIEYNGYNGGITVHRSLFDVLLRE